MEPETFRARYATLTRRQREVLRLRCQGASNQAVAWQLFVAERTVKNHMTSILSWMGLRGKRGRAVVCVQLSADEAGD